MKLNLIDRLNKLSMDNLYSEIIMFNEIYKLVSNTDEFKNLNNASEK